MCRFKFAFQTVCVLLRFVYGGRLSPHPFNILSLLFYFVLAKRQCAAPNLPALCRFKFAFQTVCISPTACVRRAALAAPFRHCAGSNSPALCRFKFAFQTVCVSPTACVRRAALAAPFRQCAGSNSPFKLFAYRRQLVYGERL